MIKRTIKTFFKLVLFIPKIIIKTLKKLFNFKRPNKYDLIKEYVRFAKIKNLDININVQYGDDLEINIRDKQDIRTKGRPKKEDQKEKTV